MFYKDFNLYAQKIDLKGKSFKVYSEKFSKSVSAKTDFATTILTYSHSPDGNEF